MKDLLRLTPGANRLRVRSSRRGADPPEPDSDGLAAGNRNAGGGTDGGLGIGKRRQTKRRFRFHPGISRLGKTWGPFSTPVSSASLRRQISQAEGHDMPLPASRAPEREPGPISPGPPMRILGAFVQREEDRDRGTLRGLLGHLRRLVCLVLRGHLRQMTLPEKPFPSYPILGHSCTALRHAKPENHYWKIGD